MLPAADGLNQLGYRNATEAEMKNWARIPPEDYDSAAVAEADVQRVWTDSINLGSASNKVKVIQPTNISEDAREGENAKQGDICLNSSCNSSSGSLELLESCFQETPSATPKASRTVGHAVSTCKKAEKRRRYNSTPIWHVLDRVARVTPSSESDSGCNLSNISLSPIPSPVRKDMDDTDKPAMAAADGIVDVETDSETELDPTKAR